MVVVIGTSGSGKSTFCKKHFLPTEILSSDALRAMISDDEDRLDISTEAFDTLHYLLEKRLELGRLTVVDATNVQKEARAPLIKIATKWHALRVAIFIDTPVPICHERNAQRPNRGFGPHVLRNQRADFKRALGATRSERWHKIYTVTPETIDQVEIVRERSWSRNPEEHGPFDIIGDVHGCYDELQSLIAELGWKTEPELHHPEGRKLFFVGDLVDRGPEPVKVLSFAMDAVESGKAICVPGNHDIRLVKALKGQPTSSGHGLKETLEQVQAEPEEFQERVRNFLHGLVSHQVVDDGKLCVAHAGLPEKMQGRGSPAVRDFCLFGGTTGERDEFGLPVRAEWAKDYRGSAFVVFGHTPVPEPDLHNNTINIDTGCCFGGRLTAYRYPEGQLVSVPAKAMYAEPARPLELSTSTAEEEDDVLDIAEVLGRRSIETSLAGRVTIREENAIAALEAMSRFAVDPRWLIYLPPTMSPSETSSQEGYLEYPDEALKFYKDAGVQQVICEQKHMGSRAVAVVCKDQATALARFGVGTGEIGTIYTRTGRQFFADVATQNQALDRLSKAISAAGVFEELESDWVLLDMEVMPWSAKAVGLISSQYGPVGAASEHYSKVLQEALSSPVLRTVNGIQGIVELADRKVDSAERYRAAYRNYCWTVNSIDDYKFAPFHLIASEGKVHNDRSHLWHLEILGRIADQDPAILIRTPYRLVDLDNEDACQAATQWWLEHTGSGGEGMVVKPLNFTEFKQDRVIQPAVKCRGREYLRIIYGPEYLEEANLSRLRRRGLSRKRSLAHREYALGIEALTRFVNRKALRNVHECVFGVLALESEPVDPRL